MREHSVSKLVLGLILAFSVLLTACNQQSTGIVCDKPYMRYGADCCLDQNANGVCDKDETQQQQAAPAQQNTAPAPSPTCEGNAILAPFEGAGRQLKTYAELREFVKTEPSMDAQTREQYLSLSDKQFATLLQIYETPEGLVTCMTPTTFKPTG